MHLQLFVGLAEKLVGSQIASRIAPPGIQHASDLPEHLKQTGYIDITSTPYSHPLVFTMPDLIEFLVGPHSQFAGMLHKLKASGRTDIHQEAQQVSASCVQH